ncbi:MAG: hypothetical protein FWE87_04185 [Coriobacteriia bacterium]|nr:hypothetical protein [Coriobacteriia bacterium]
MSANKNNSSSAFSDPVVRILAAVFTLLLLWALLTVITLFVTRGVSITNTPLTMTENEVVRAQSQVEQNPTADNYQNLIVALVGADRLSEAERVLAQAQAEELDVIRGQQILFSEAYLNEAKGNYSEALRLYQEVVDRTFEAFQTELAAGGERNWAMSYGIHQNHQQSLLKLAGSAIENAQYDQAISFLDRYLEISPTDASVLVDRAQAKMGAGDYQGALDDFATASIFLPDDPEVIQGLEQAKEKIND